MSRYISITILVTILLSGIQCTKKDNSSLPVTGQLYLHLHTNIDTTEVESYNTIINSNNGRKVSLSLAQMYISAIELIKLDGSVLAVTDKVLLKTLETESYLLGNVPVGNYKSIRFEVGLNATENNISPALNDSVFYRPEMWFGTSAQPSGYIFVNIEGKIDTTANGNSTVAQMAPFSYKIGTIANSKQVILPDNNFTVLPNLAEYVHVTVNYMKLFEGVDITKSYNLSVQNQVDNTGATAKQIMNNIPNMFRYE